jgi:dTDP-4-dehydrorhamnose reductase
MKALIAGSGGQLGRMLQRTAPADAVVVAPAEAAFDITDPAVVEAVVAQHKPDVLLNAAAYTAVDKAESELERARLINATAVGHLAAACARHGATLVHVSTDFVFDGETSRAYRPDDAARPLGAYGLTKWEGEQAAGADALIVRTAWVYGPVGHNFVRTMLRLMAERPEVRVVADQIGTPTYAPGLAQALWALAGQRARGVFHHTDSGAASWYDFAVAIQEEALAVGLLNAAVPIIPIATSDYPTPAKRPAFSVLDKAKTTAALGAPAPHWRVNLRAMIQEVAIHG